MSCQMRLACLPYSPRLLVRPESTDFIGCFPLRIRRCQQHKNKIVAIVPSKSSNSRSTHWTLYGLNSTKNAAAIIIRRDVGQIPQPQTAGSTLLSLCRWKIKMGIKTVTDTRGASCYVSWRACGFKVDSLDHHNCEAQCMTQQRSWALFIYLFQTGRKASQQIHLSIAEICCRVPCPKGSWCNTNNNKTNICVCKGQESRDS